MENNQDGQDHTENEMMCQRFTTYLERTWAPILSLWTTLTAHPKAHLHLHPSVCFLCGQEEDELNDEDLVEVQWVCILLNNLM